MTANRHIVLSSDHHGLDLRRAIAAHVAALGWTPVDIGPTTAETGAYPEQGAAAARRVASGDCRFGIVLCGSGQGIMMVANKVRGVRCGLGIDPTAAEMMRRHNDANMLSLGAGLVDEATALRIVEAFLTAPFDGGRHAARVAMIAALETDQTGG